MSHHDSVVAGSDIVILSAARTPIGKFQGALSGIPAPQLGAVAIRAAIERAGIDPALLAEVIMGNVVPAGEGQAPARQAAIAAGLPASVGALTINKVCGSGLKAVMLAAASIRAGDGDFYVAGGMENMNLAPYLLTKARFGYRLGNAELVDAIVHDGLWCPFEHQHMGLAAEWIAEALRGQPRGAGRVCLRQPYAGARRAGCGQVPRRKSQPCPCRSARGRRRCSRRTRIPAGTPALTCCGRSSRRSKKAAR